MPGLGAGAGFFDGATDRAGGGGGGAVTVVGWLVGCSDGFSVDFSMYPPNQSYITVVSLDFA